MIAPLPISWLIEGLIASTVLMLLVLALRTPVRKAFGAEIAYALWLLPALRLLLPPLPTGWQSLWHGATVAPITHATETVTVLLIEPVAKSAAVAAPAFAMIAPALALVWMIGAAGFVAWHTLAHRRFCRRMLDSAASTEQLGGVHVIRTDAASGPLAFGIWRRYVAFPRDFAERYDPEERDLALAHELGHHARGDLIANWVALVVLALHWFNPIAWRAFRVFRADQEIANDARVLAGMNPMRRHTYACAILKAAHGGTVSAACHLHTIDDLKGRLKMLTTNKTSRMRLMTGAGALALLVTAGLGLTASGTAAAAKVRNTVESATGVNLASLDQVAPVVPPPPAASTPWVEPPAPAVQSAPTMRSEVPPMPEMATMPAMPPVTVPPRAPGAGDIDPPFDVTSDGRSPHKVIRLVRRDKDGKMLPGTFVNMPNIRSENCKAAGKEGIAVNKMVINEGKDGKRAIVICVDRIQMVARAGADKGAAMAANSKEIERNAYRQALAGLRKARAEMIAKRGESDNHSTEALPAIDTAIAEIEADLAGVE